MDKSKMVPVIVTGGNPDTCVIFGWAEAQPEAGESVVLWDARMILFWEGQSGLFGVAVKGPGIGSRITSAVSRVSHGVAVRVLNCSPEAARVLDQWGVK